MNSTPAASKARFTTSSVARLSLCTSSCLAVALAMEFAFVFAMWAVMMIAMMTPSASPMILIYARVGRQAAQQGKPLAASAWFAAGYFLAWIGFALAAASAQWAFERAALLTPMMAGASDVFGGAVLVAAGVYQWTPLKDVCLRQCQAPWLFIQRHGGFRPDVPGSLALGAAMAPIASAAAGY